MQKKMLCLINSKQKVLKPLKINTKKLTEITGTVTSLKTPFSNTGISMDDVQ